METNDFGFDFNNSFAQLPESLFTFVKPASVPDPKVVIINDNLAKFLGLNAQSLRTDLGVAILAGQHAPEGSSSLAQAYAGHQFGHFTMLGDGRAILLGEQLTPSGESYDLQFKGSGRTPYSRGGDGKATLGPMLREYIISEAMYALNIPTTRSLAVVTTGEIVLREEDLPGAILTRVASSHLRVGTFQYSANWQTQDELKALADYAIARHYPEVAEEKNKYLSLLREVIRAQASLVSKWMLVGFIHGVMNTDNMTISGETIDYGPCAFMDTFDPATVFSSIDRQGRYAYANQPKIASWNLARFADSLLPLIDRDQEKAIKLAEAELELFPDIYDQYYMQGMRSKLGLMNKQEEDKALVRDLLHLMYEHQADYTNTFLDLTFNTSEQVPLATADNFLAWKKRWQKRLEKNPGDWSATQELMKMSNPALIPRNHRVEEALRPAVQAGDYKPLHKLLKVLADPFAHSQAQEEYAKPPEPSAVPYQTFCGT